MPITHYPLTDPETGEKISNFETLSDEIIGQLRDEGLSDDEIRFYKIESHNASRTVGALVDMLLMPPDTSNSDN